MQEVCKEIEKSVRDYIQNLNNQIEDVNARISMNINSTAIEYLTDRINMLEKKLEEIENES